MAIISQPTRQFMPDGAVTASPTHRLQRRAALLETAAEREKNRCEVLRNVCDFAAVLQRSSPQEILNEHQSKGNRGPRGELEPSSSLSVGPQRGGWLLKKGIWWNLNSPGQKVRQYSAIMAISDSTSPR